MLQQSLWCALLPPVAPIEEVSHDHSTAELVSGRCLSISIRLPVVNGDRLFLDRAVVSDSVVREDYF